MTPAPLPRSFLYVPGNRPELFDKACGYGADALILDLEDAVPQQQKDAARVHVATWLQTAKASAAAVFVRINEAAAGVRDVEALPLAHLRGIRIPKCEDDGFVARVCAILDERESGAGSPQPGVEIHAGIESAKGLFATAQIAGACERVTRFAFGAADFARDVGAFPGADRNETLFARSYLVAMSRALGKAPPIGQVWSAIDDVDGLRAACAADRALGFRGRPCLHPKQIAVVNEAFGPTEAEIAQARRIVQAYGEAGQRGSGAFRLEDGTFVDAAGFKRAQALLAQSGLQ